MAASDLSDLPIGAAVDDGRSELAIVLEALDEGIAIYDADSRLVSWNMLYQTLCGLPPGTLAAGLSRAEVVELVVEHLGADRLPLGLATTFSRSGRPTALGEVLGRSGQIVQSICLPMADGRYLIKLRDVTARRRAEQEARQAHETLEAKVAARTAELEAARSELQQVIDALPIGITVYDRDERLRLANHWLYATYPVAMREMESMPALEQRVWEACRSHGVLAGKSDAEAAALVADNLAAIRGYRTDEATLPSGRRLRFSSARLPDGQLITTTVDVTETYQAGEVLRAAEHKLAGIIDAMPVGVVVYGPDDRLQVVNSAARELHPVVGRDATIGESLRQHCRALLGELGRLDGLSPDEIEAKVDGWMALVPKSGTAEHEYPYPDGRVIRDRAQRLADGSVVFVHVDLTDVRRVQEELARAERLSSLSVMIAGLAHEINTPIGIGMTAATHLFAAVQAIRDKAEGRSMTRTDWASFMADAETSADILSKNLRRAGDLVRNFRQLSADEVSDVRSRLDLGDHIRDVLGSLEPELRRHPHSVTVDCPPGLLVDSYPGALAQIVVNLVMNGLVHAFPDKRPGSIGFSAARDGDALVLRYADDGVGVTDAVARRMFEPFFTTRRAQGGTGLGLSVVHALVTQRLKGTIALRKRIGDGLEFEIRLPGSRRAG
ncbi:MAG: PAS-domain containing protein [Aliidongia sp.]